MKSVPGTDPAGCVPGTLFLRPASIRCSIAKGGRNTLKPMVLGVLLLLSGACQGFAWDEPKAMTERRLQMVRSQIESRGVRNARVLEAMRNVPRHLFVDKALEGQAYQDHPLPIGEGQTISQPYIVALMTELLDPQPEQRVLEIGTGSGYQAAVLSPLVKEVYSIEIKEPLYRSATETLGRLGFANVRTRHGDGYFGWPEAQPFDSIIITAAVDHVPPPLLQQLRDGGRMVLPLGHPFGYQNLVLVTKEGSDYRLEQVLGVIFVPMTGRAMEGKP
jgi:protein-L-isoaspartate(D-aspartate) O-methyltransferase